MDKTILIATEKPFSAETINIIRQKIDQATGFNLTLLEGYTTKNELLEALIGVDGLVVRSDKINAEILKSSDNLRIIIRAGSGYDNIDLDAAIEKDIVVMNTPGQNANAVAELAFALMLVLIRKNFQGNIGTELKGKRIGMQGYGNIGKCMGLIAKGFGMRICAYDPYISPIIMENDGVECCESLAKLFSDCDFISVNIPINKETIKTIDYNLLSKTKKNAVLVNTARKEVINEADLMQWLQESQGFRYASDIAPDCRKEIVEKYPDKTLFTARKMGAQTNEANIHGATAAIQQIINFFEKGDRTYQVN